MTTRKHYIIRFTDQHGCTFYLNRNLRAFKWTNHGKDKEYKTLKPALKKAQALRHKLLQQEYGKVEVLKVTYEPCNPELPDGYYRPVQTVVV